MGVMWLVLPLALLIAGGFLVACVRAIRTGQFDDLETPAHRAVWDDEPAGAAGAALPDADLPRAAPATRERPGYTPPRGGRER